MNDSQKKQLLGVALSKYDLVQADDIYGGASLESVGRIIIALASSLGDPFTKQNIQSKAIQEFLKTGALTDRETFIQIINDKKIETNE